MIIVVTIITGIITNIGITNASVALVAPLAAAPNPGSCPCAAVIGRGVVVVAGAAKARIPSSATTTLHTLSCRCCRCCHWCCICCICSVFGILRGKQGAQLLSNSSSITFSVTATAATTASRITAVFGCADARANGSANSSA